MTMRLVVKNAVWSRFLRVAMFVCVWFASSTVYFLTFVHFNFDSTVLPLMTVNFITVLSW